MSNAYRKILQRVLVAQFYEANAGFFLFLFFVLFGMIAPGQQIAYHLSLIHGMIRSYPFLLCVIFLWTLYTAKCVNFINGQIQEPRQQFLFVLQHFPQAKQRFLLLFVHLQVLAPMLVYAAIVAAVAAKENTYGSMGMVILSISLFITVAVFLALRCLQKRPVALPRLFPRVHVQLPKPLALLPLWYLWKNKKQMLLATKLFTLALLYLFMALNERDNSDIRPLLLVLLLVGIAHAAIVFQMRAFEEEYTSFTRNLPLRAWTRFGGMLFCFLCLLLPELAFLWKGFPAQFALIDYPHLLLFLVSLPVFFYCVLLIKETDMEHFLRSMLLMCSALFFVIFYSPGIVLPLGLLLLSFVFFRAHFDTFEKRLT